MWMILHSLWANPVAEGKNPNETWTISTGALGQCRKWKQFMKSTRPVSRICFKFRTT